MIFIDFIYAIKSKAIYYLFLLEHIKFMAQRKIDPETGLMERSVNIEDYLEVKDVPSWGRPKGTNIFERINPAVNYFDRQRSQ